MAPAYSTYDVEPWYPQGPAGTWDGTGVPPVGTRDATIDFAEQILGWSNCYRKIEVACDSSSLCFRGDGETPAFIERALPLLDGGKVRVRWSLHRTAATSADTCRLLLGGKVVETLAVEGDDVSNSDSNVTNVNKTTESQFSRGDKLRVEASSGNVVCAVHAVDMQRPPYRKCDGHIKSEGWTLVKDSLDGPTAARGYSGYYLRFGPRTRPTHDLSSYTVAVQLAGGGG